ncbi:MAG: hypothetical protein OEW75_06485, partial [Cyclobacteriaceae bacterium]|nr:hypothetical protein [Cyclobacteriaceae bacterium]
MKFILYNFIIVFFSLCALEGVCSYLLNHPKKIPNLLLTSFKSYYKNYDRLTIQVIPACASYNSN